MIVVRFRVRCVPDKTEQMRTAMAALVGPSRALAGVIHFDVAQDITDPNALIATEVFEDRAAMDRQEGLPDVARVMELVETGALAGAPEWTIYEVSSAESPEM
ncbi:MAG TPA: antibiotic biosynthesis monooxygenase [Actinomycetota bacterium]